MTKQTKVQTIETLKLDALKVSHRYQIALVAFAFVSLGTVFGYFMSIQVINDTQSKVVNSIQVTAVSKEVQ